MSNRPESISPRNNRNRNVRQIRPTRAAFRLDRLNIARIASGIGAFALIGAILAYLLQNDITPFVVAFALFAMIGIGAWVALAPEDIRALVSGRRAAYGSNTVFITALLIGILTVIFAIAQSTSLAVDFTTFGFYKLKPDIAPVITTLTEPIVITAFYSNRLLTLKSNDRPILKMFQDAAPDRVQIVTIDPDEQPLVARQFGLTQELGIYVSFLDAAGNPDLTRTRQMQGSFATEKQIAEAILELRNRGRYRVLFTIGHGELTTEGTAPDAAALRISLESIGVLTGTLDLALQPIPADTSALVVLAPQRDFSQETTDKIAAYMAAGGKILICAEPGYTSDYQFMQLPDSPMANYLWTTWGVRPERDIVFDPDTNGFVGDPYYIYPTIRDEGEPLIDKDNSGAEARPLFRIVQSFQIDPNPRPNYAVKPLYASSEQSFGKLDLREAARTPNAVVKSPTDPAGPLNLMVAARATNATADRQEARLILVGDADWLRTDLISDYDGQALWVGVMDWLTNVIEQVTVRPISAQLPMSVPQGDLNAVAVLTLIILPGLALVGATATWIDRQRRG